MHIGVFILLLLSGERNFGVRLNKPYTVRVPMDIPVFTGTHADFLIIVSTESHSNIQCFTSVRSFWWSLIFKKTHPGLMVCFLLSQASNVNIVFHLFSV